MLFLALVLLCVLSACLAESACMWLQQYILMCDTQRTDHVRGTQFYTLIKCFYTAFTALSALYGSYLIFAVQMLLAVRRQIFWAVESVSAE